MEWIIVLVAVAGLVFWMSRGGGVTGFVSRALLRAIPRPTIDTRLLPRSLVAGLVLAAITIAIHLTAPIGVVYAVGLVIGPFVGGALLRTRWWAPVAAIVAVAVATGGEVRPLYVALPVALVAYAGTMWERPKWLRPRGTATGQQ